MAGKVLRRVAFRYALTSGAAITALSTGGCALLPATAPFGWMFSALFLSGMARSVLFTGMMALTFADVTPEELNGTTLLNNLSHAIAAALSIALATALLNLGATLAPIALDIDTYRVALLVFAAAGLVAVPLFARLPIDSVTAVGAHQPAPSS